MREHLSELAAPIVQGQGLMEEPGITLGQTRRRDESPGAVKAR